MAGGAAARAGVVVMALVLAGCTAEEAPSAPGRTDQQAPDVTLYWQGRPEGHRLVGREAWVEGGMAHLFAHEEGIEGGDFGLTLQWRGAGPLVYDNRVGTNGTFRFEYTEAIFWHGEAVCRLRSVDHASTLSVQGPGVGRSHGSFDLHFSGDCPDERPGTYTRHITGHW
jgi:hypothetical protein